VRRRSGREPRAGAANEICSEPRDGGAGLAGALQCATHGAEREEEEELRSRENMPPRPPSNREHPRLPAASDAGKARGHRGVGVWEWNGAERRT